MFLTSLLVDYCYTKGSLDTIAINDRITNVRHYVAKMLLFFVFLSYPF